MLWLHSTLCAVRLENLERGTGGTSFGFLDGATVRVTCTNCIVVFGGDIVGLGLELVAARRQDIHVFLHVFAKFKERVGLVGQSLVQGGQLLGQRFDFLLAGFDHAPQSETELAENGTFAFEAGV